MRRLGLLLVAVFAGYGGLPARAAAPSPKPAPPAQPAVVAVVDDVTLTSVAAGGGRLYFGGARDITRPPDAGAGPSTEARGVVRRAPVGRGPVEELWSGPGGVAAVALTASGIYFLTYDYGWRRGALMHLAPGRRDAETLGTWHSHGSVHSLAVQGDAAYWTHSAGASSSVVRSVAATKDQPSATATLAEGGEIGGADDLCVMGGNAYWISGRRALYRMPIAEKKPTMIFEGPYLSSLAADPGGGVLYIGVSQGANVASSRIVRFDAGTRRATTITTTDQHILTMVATSDAVYFTTGAGAPQGTAPVDVVRVSRRGGAVTTVAASQPPPVALAFDGNWLFWTAGTRVLKAPR